MKVIYQPRGTIFNEGGTLLWSSYHEVGVPYDIENSSRAGEKTPGWDKPRRDGSLVMNYYERSQNRVVTPPPYCIHRSKSHESEDIRKDIVTYFSFEEACSYFQCKGVESSQITGESDPDALKRKALERANGEDWNVAVMIAEGHETLAMLAQAYQLAKNPTRSLTDAFCKLVKKNRRLSVHKASLSQVFGSASSAWLTYQLGVYPLIKDFESARDFVRKRYKLMYRASVRPSSTYQKYTDTEWTSPHGGGSGLPAGSVILTQRASLQQRDVATITSDYNYKNYTDLFTEKLGLRFSQTPLLIWEKVPFSFLLDYLVDIGGWLQQVREPVGLTTRAACYSSKGVTGSISEPHSLRWQSISDGVVWDQSISWAGGTSASRGFQFSRIPYDSRAAPFHPSWGSGLSVVRSANIASLAYLASRRKLKMLRVN